jgi:hypothetical protein
MTNPPTPPYTEATVELAGAALETYYEGLGLPRSMARPFAAATQVLDALAAAGLLLPEGAETRTEWGWDCGHPRAPEQRCVHPGVEDWARATAVRVWPDGALVSRWIAETPWDAVRLAEGDPSNGAAEGGGKADQSKERA